jgi:redox-sensitive bicupin YhaK (pirin superfamily)
MLKYFPYSELGHADHGWLDARHHFSFGGYHNPYRMGFGALRVINDDVIAAGRGFAQHPHDNMEIITYVRSGAISHQDSEGNTGRTGAGDVQVMSAGTGIRHSEHNHEQEKTTLFQIWILPREQGVKPRWDAKAFPKTPVTERLNLLVSGFAEDENSGALTIHQDARIFGGRIAAGTTLTHPLRQQAYLLVSEGSALLNGHPITKGDGVEITAETSLTLQAQTEAEVLVIEVPEFL